jgi:MFS family permease
VRSAKDRDREAVGAVRLGLRANWRQFTLLVAINGLVGAMVGLERVVLPLLAQQDFQISSRAAILSFIVSFGIVKALANLFAGRISDRIGRKAVLVTGWIFGLPVPVLVFVAPSWSWIVAANILLGINQGLCWSTTVIMKVDLAGPKRRGLAMGLNEASGYLAVSLAALASGLLAAQYGLRTAPFVLGECFATAGLLLSIAYVRDSTAHVRHESGSHSAGPDFSPPFSEIFYQTSWKNRSLFAISQAGLANNLNDGMAWGLYPLYYASLGLSLGRISFLAALYPAVWGVAQLGTGALSDRVGRKRLIAGGMVFQGAGIFLVLLTAEFRALVAGAFLLGLGTAMVYPTLLAAIGDLAHPNWRASAVGVYRLWRDSGYALGALFSGVLADWFGMRLAIGSVAALTVLSGVLVAVCMRETLSRAGPPTIAEMEQA